MTQDAEFEAVVDDIVDTLLAQGESVDLEVKEAQGRGGTGEVPRSLWETYSAMANTEGGTVILGVRELEKGHYKVVGIRDPAKVRKALWDSLNNRNQVSANILTDHHIKVATHEGRHVVWINVPRAPRAQRPVYVGTNPLTGTFRRNFEGDYRCDAITVRRMLADATEESRDTRILPGYGMADIDSDCLAAYRHEMRATKPGHPWVSLDDFELLRNLGGWSRDRRDNQEGLTIAGLLMFGRLRSILDEVPTYIVDYQERDTDNADVRWTDRVTTDGTWSGNLFDFYRRVYLKLIDGLKVPFRLEHGAKRVDESHVHEALREALVNSLIHADYSGSVGTLVIKAPQKFAFRNPGGLRLPLRTVLEGGTSDCRNRTLQKMFQLIGASEQAGSGIPKILRAWQEQQWRTPLLAGDSEAEQTLLQLPMTSLLPQDALDELDRMYGKSFRSLADVERLAVATALIEGKVTNERLRDLTGKHPSDLTVLLHGLVDHRFLVQEGVGRGTFYQCRRHGGPEAIAASLFDTGSEHLAAGSEHLAAGSEHLAAGSEHLAAGEDLVARVRTSGKAPVKAIEEAIRFLCRERFLSLAELASALNRSPDTLRTHYLVRLIDSGQIVLRHADKPNHPEQGYRTGASS